MSAVWCVLCRVWPLLIILALTVIRSWTVWAQSSFFWLLDCVLVCDIWEPVREHSSIRFSVNFASATTILPRTSLSSSHCGSGCRALGFCCLMLLPFVDNGILTPSPPSLSRQCCLVPKGRPLPETLRWTFNISCTGQMDHSGFSYPQFLTLSDTSPFSVSKSPGSHIFSSGKYSIKWGDPDAEMWNPQVLSHMDLTFRVCLDVNTGLQERIETVD